MKKVIGLFAFMFLLSFGSFAQSLELAKLTSTENKKCIPTKECAAKMGVSLEECKKICAKTCNKTSVASAGAEQTDAEVNGEKKACSKTCSKSKVASAGAEKENLAKTVSNEPVEKKKNCKAKCAGKKKTTES